jgi:Phosphodiester glycosidase
MSDAVNLDGGGSTAMSVDSVLVNQPSGTSERAVGDALVYVDGPQRRGPRRLDQAPRSGRRRHKNSGPWYA